MRRIQIPITEDTFHRALRPEPLGRVPEDPDDPYVLTGLQFDPELPAVLRSVGVFILVLALSGSVLVVSPVVSSIPVVVSLPPVESGHPVVSVSPAVVVVVVPPQCSSAM